MLGRKPAWKVTTVAIGIAGCMSYEALNLAGFGSATAAHWLILLAWAGAVFLIYTSRPVSRWTAHFRVPATIAAGSLIGVGALYLYAIDLPPYPNARVVIDINLLSPDQVPTGNHAYLASSLTKRKAEQNAITKAN